MSPTQTAPCSTLLLSISLRARDIGGHNSPVQETPKLNSSCRGVGQAGMPGPKEGCWIWGEKAQQTCSDGQRRSQPLGSPHPTTSVGLMGKRLSGGQRPAGLLTDSHIPLS